MLMRMLAVTISDSQHNWWIQTKLIMVCLMNMMLDITQNIWFQVIGTMCATRFGKNTVISFYLSLTYSALSFLLFDSFIVCFIPSRVEVSVVSTIWRQGVLERLAFFFQIIEPEWRNLKLADSKMLKLESAYKHSFPKD